MQSEFGRSYRKIYHEELELKLTDSGERKEMTVEERLERAGEAAMGKYNLDFQINSATVPTLLIPIS